MTTGFQTTPEIQDFLDDLDNQRNVMLTGRAGTGKSTVTERFTRNTTRKVAVLAPTGTAAINVGGQTIHSFFGFGPGVTTSHAAQMEDKGEKLSKLDCLVIDEVSMVRADLMDCMDLVLRRNGPMAGAPFGGVNMVLVGDPYQLEPVCPPEDEPLLKEYTTPFFFGSKIWRSARFMGRSFHVHELTHPFRQQAGSEFLKILDNVREGTLEAEQLRVLNQRLGPRRPSAQYVLDRDTTILTTMREPAARYNQQVLSLLKGRVYHFAARMEGRFTFMAEKDRPTETDLMLKIGAKVMLLRNNLPHWSNGTIATVEAVTSDGIWVTLPDGDSVLVGEQDWDSHHYETQEGQLKRVVDGTFHQMPLRLAWAITIHKAQGVTLDRGIVDLGRQTFAYGQLYVALSRLRTIEGLELTRPIKVEDVKVSPDVRQFMAEELYQPAGPDFEVMERLV